MGLDKVSSRTLHCSSNMLPETIGDYKVLDSLGSGTFGDVYKVEKEGQLYALKNIVLGSSMDKLAIQLEIDSHGSLPEHKNIVRLIHHVKGWYRWNIVLEYCDLGTLERYVVARKPDTEVIKSFMYDMASGLDHLHSNNIVHRDIKPENILLVQGRSKIPTCKISDFGVARYISGDGSTQKNGNKNGELYFKTFRGSPFFVAPEVQKGQYTESCDIFSLGIVFYLMFARVISSDKKLVPCIQGGTPFYRATDTQVKDQVDLHVSDNTLNHLIKSMLVVDLHGRISAASLVKALQGNEMSHGEVDEISKDDVDKTMKGEVENTSKDKIDKTNKSKLDKISMDEVDKIFEDEIYNDDICIISRDDVAGISSEEYISATAETCLTSSDEECLPSKDEVFFVPKFDPYVKPTSTSSKDVVNMPLKDGTGQSSTAITSTSSSHKTSTSSKDQSSTSSKSEVFLSFEDEVFLAACVLVAILIMAWWLPFPLFVLCMAILLVAGWEFLPKRTLENISLLT